jgi:AraC-like DNA-binding protein
LEHIRDENKPVLSPSFLREIEKELIRKLDVVLSPLPPAHPTAIPRPNPGEVAAFSVMEKFFSHMDGRFDSRELAALYGITPVTLQNGFKTLTGFTLQKFFRILKLNLAHSELVASAKGEKTVSQIASRWGFTHLGRFSGYYKELFGESPSETLAKRRPYNAIESNCVARREEMTD